jgi:hypothetical protein
MARAFLWRNRRVEIQTHYQEHGVCVSVRIDGQEMGSYEHFEQALAAIRTVVIGNAPFPSPVAIPVGPGHPPTESDRAG